MSLGEGLDLTSLQDQLPVEVGGELHYHIHTWISGEKAHVLVPSVCTYIKVCTERIQVEQRLAEEEHVNLVDPIVLATLVDTVSFFLN